MRFPPFPEVPEPLRGGSFALVEMAFLGTEADGASLLEPLRSLRPALDTFAMVPPVGLAELHMDPREPVPYVLDHQLLGDLPAKAIDELVSVAGAESGSSLLSFELRHTGGALARSAPGHGALDTLRGSFASMGIGLDVDAEMAAANRARMAMIRDALTPHDVGRYSNFTEEQGAVERFFEPETYRRLQAVKAQYDPENVFRANHPISQER
jgi:hypothetical protein